jgi:hypothetical protein
MASSSTRIARRLPDAVLSMGRQWRADQRVRERSFPVFLCFLMENHARERYSIYDLGPVRPVISMPRSMNSSSAPVISERPPSLPIPYSRRWGWFCEGTHRSRYPWWHR